MEQLIWVLRGCGVYAAAILLSKDELEVSKYSQIVFALGVVPRERLLFEGCRYLSDVLIE
jgi:hypothetical protein